MSGSRILHIGWLFFVLVSIVSCGHPPGLKVYVSPKGSDSNKGTQEAPFQTITKARDHLRSLNGTNQDIEVILSGGTYFIDEPIVFNLIDGGNQEMLPEAADIEMAGASRDQKLAAIMTPAAKPSIRSRILRPGCRKIKTVAAPAAVTPQVNRVATRACVT